MTTRRITASGALVASIFAGFKCRSPEIDKITAAAEASVCVSVRSTPDSKQERRVAYNSRVTDAALSFMNVEVTPLEGTDLFVVRHTNKGKRSYSEANVPRCEESQIKAEIRSAAEAFAKTAVCIQPGVGPNSVVHTAAIDAAFLRLDLDNRVLGNFDSDGKYRFADGSDLGGTKVHINGFGPYYDVRYSGAVNVSVSLWECGRILVYRGES